MHEKITSIEQALNTKGYGYVIDTPVGILIALTASDENQVDSGFSLFTDKDYTVEHAHRVLQSVSEFDPEFHRELKGVRLVSFTLEDEGPIVTKPEV